MAFILLKVHRYEQPPLPKRIAERISHRLGRGHCFMLTFADITELMQAPDIWGAVVMRWRSRLKAAM